MARGAEEWLDAIFIRVQVCVIVLCTTNQNEKNAFNAEREMTKYVENRKLQVE